MVSNSVVSINIHTFIRKSLGILFVCFGATAQGQELQPISGSVSGGFVVPLGKQLSNAYTIGFEFGAGVTFRSNKMFIGLEGSAEHYVNSPPSTSSIKDRLTIFTPSLQLGYTFPLQSNYLDVFASVGYAWGTNSISDAVVFGNSLDLLELEGVSIGPGLTFRFNDKASISARYLFYSPSYTLTEEALSGITGSSRPTQLYGPIIAIPDGKFAMDRLSVRFNWKL